MGFSTIPFQFFPAHRKPLLMLGCLLFSHWLFAQPDFLQWQSNKPCTHWVDSVYNTLTPEERIGQFFMLAAYTDGKNYNMDSVLSLIRSGKAGGVIFFKGNPTAQAVWTNRIQNTGKVGSFIAIDGEWGLAMRLDSTISFPRQMTLGALSQNDLIYQMGREIGRECKRIGININFAPVVDINNNPLNPVINERSFGEDKYQVALKGLEYASGLQQEGVLACAKHFPGHGDVTVDSHKDLPTITKSYSSLDSFEFYPFKIMFNNGTGSVMIAHLNVPSLDSDSNSVASLSHKIATDLLRDTLGFQGLAFSDALNMRGVSKFYTPGTVDSIAFMAGCDILVFSENASSGISKIKMALDSGIISGPEMEARVKKVLAYKYLLGLNHPAQIKTDSLYQDLNTIEAQNLCQKLFEQSLTIAANQDKLLPFHNWNYKKVASLSIGNTGYTRFQNSINDFVEVSLFNQSDDRNSKAFDSLIDTLATYDLVIIDLHGMSRYAARDYNVTDESKKFIEALSGRTKVVLTVFGNAYSLRFFQFLPWVVCAYEDNDYTNLAAANALFGAEQIAGRLPVTSCDSFPAGKGFMFDTIYRLKISSPIEAGINPDKFRHLDEIINSAISKKAFPGCQLLIAKDGQVILNKTYGSKVYEFNDPVRKTDLYDIASITKVAATTLAVMKLYDEKKIDLNGTVEDYLKLPKNATIKHLHVRDILTHQAGLKPFFMFWKQTVGDSFATYYRTTPQNNFTIQVADSLYLRNDFPDSMWMQIATSEVNPHPKYVYSDLDFYILQKIVEAVSGESLDEYVRKNFYEPMGLTRIGYLPLKRFTKGRIPPTENDTSFRKQLIRGYVHDQGCAMYGGVAGHAGVFSNAFDLAAVFQMLLNGGNYNHHSFLKPSTIKLFTSRQSKISRRGFGFDKPEPDVTKPSPCYDGTPLMVFGHTGFTGTCVWSDPENNLTYIFLSNRVYPNAENNMLVKLNVRTDLQESIYKALVK